VRKWKGKRKTDSEKHSYTGRYHSSKKTFREVRGRRGSVSTKKRGKDAGPFREKGILRAISMGVRHKREVRWGAKRKKRGHLVNRKKKKRERQ